MHPPPPDSQRPSDSSSDSLSNNGSVDSGDGESVSKEILGSTEGKLKVDDPRRADHLDNYKWKKGESGNPLGKRKGEVNLTSRLKKQLMKDLGKSGGTQADAVLAALISEARSGNIHAINMILDRVEGKVTDQIQMSGAAVMFNIVEAVRPDGS